MFRFIHHKIFSFGRVLAEMRGLFFCKKNLYRVLKETFFAILLVYIYFQNI
nr:MAG TPA: hypothetical protein [Caudoviricetes sp.]